MATQNNWRWCNKCQGLFYAGFGSGTCPAGGTHSPPASSGSGNYVLTHSVTPAGYQGDWRWCNKCQGLFYAGFPTSGHCPVGGGHNYSNSGAYAVKTTAPVGSEQNNWRWCNKCLGLFYAGTRTTGFCPATGGHNYVNSGNYVLLF